MAIWSGLFIPGIDLVSRALTADVRARLTDSGPMMSALWAEMLRHGGRRGLVEHARRHGYRGKWLQDAEEPAGAGAELGAELGQRWLAMKARQQSVSPAYLPAEAWAESLEQEWRAPRRAAESGDWGAFCAFLRNFFRNGAISGLWGAQRMFDTFAECSKWDDAQRLALFMRQYEAWRREVPNGSLDDLDEPRPRVGNPWGYDMEGRLVAEPTVEYHSLALRISDLIADVAEPVVMEIGGGYGGFARQLVRAVPNARYVGVDLPENATLQAWYLTRSLRDRSVRLWSDAPPQTELRDNRVALVPNWALENLRLDRVDVVVNVHSFSEMKRDTLEVYFGHVVRLSPRWVYHDNVSGKRRDGYDGIPASRFPALLGYRLAASCESRWPRYRHDSTYPCREYLLRREHD